MSITLNTLTYSQDSFANPNKVIYTGPVNTFSIKDLLILGRVAPKPTSTFRGIARSQVKRTQTVVLDDGSYADAIITVDFSFPVGMTQAVADNLRNDVGDFVISSDAGTLTWNHDLTY
jgi:hypothetical protein